MVERAMPLPILNKATIDCLARHQVQALYVFGSRAQGTDHPLSDYDYAILLPETGHFRGDDLYTIFYDALSSISPRTLKNDVIDIVFLREAGLELKFHVIRYGVVLYDPVPRERLRFEDHTTLLYCDYRPVLDQFDRAILERI